MHGLYLLWFVQERQLSPALVATVLAAGDLSLIAFEMPTGWFADRFGHRASLVISSLVQITGMLCCWRGPGVPALVAGSVLIALGDGFRSGADQALLYRTCVALGREDAFQTIEARTSAVGQAALVVLVLAGGAIVHVWGFAAGWAVETLCCVVGRGIALAMVEPADAPGERDDAGRQGGDTPLVSSRMAALILPASLLGAAASATSFLLQTAGDSGAARMSMVVAAIALAEAAGSAMAMRLTGGAARTPWLLAAAGGALVGMALAIPSMFLLLSTLTLRLAGLWRTRR